MDFDSTNKVLIDTMDSIEAKAFIKFLISEIKRHEMDIDNAHDLIKKVTEEFELWES